jgi:hypothetical protein
MVEMEGGRRGCTSQRAGNPAWGFRKGSWELAMAGLGPEGRADNKEAEKT